MTDDLIRKVQLKILKAFSDKPGTFALSGGTALEIFYLKHRFSRDLDFFSRVYDTNEIDELISRFSRVINKKIKLVNEYFTPAKARARFYATEVGGTKLPLKIDFIEDVFQKKPKIRIFDKISVYDAKDIYLQKIIAIIGTRLMPNHTGREIITGRKEARDIVDIYYLSKRISPIHVFLKSIDNIYQRGVIQWYRSYSRQELKLDVLDLNIYDKNFSVSEMISYIDDEIEKYIRGEIE